MILIADRGNGRVTRDDNSCMPRIYSKLVETGDFILTDNTDNIPDTHILAQSDTPAIFRR